MKWSLEIRAAEYCQKLNGKVRPRKHYRCGNCRTRKSLKRELWQYVRPPKCPCCGLVDWRLDLSRYKEWKGRKGVFDTCHCGGVWCVSHPTGPTDEDFICRYGY